MKYDIEQTDNFGFLPQFDAFGGTASYPTAVVNTLAHILLDLAPAAFSERLESYDDWVSVRDDLATQYFFTSASNDPSGTLPALGLIGLDQYLRQQQLETHIALSSIGLSVSPDNKIQAGWDEPISLSHPAIGSASQYDNFFTEQSVTGGFLRASLLRGEPIIAGLYQPIEMSSAIQGVHTLVLTALDWNDHNANGRIDESESPALTFQDPLQPALPANSIATVSYPNVESQLIGPHFTNGTLTLDEAGLLSLSYIQYKLYEEWPTSDALTLGDPQKINMTSAMYEELSVLNATVLHPASLPHHVDKLILDSDVAGIIRFDDQAFENKSIKGKLYTHEESHHDNILRFYQIAHTDGTIIDPQSNAILLPSDDGYQQLALELASTQALLDLDTRSSDDTEQLHDFTVTWSDGLMFAPLVSTSAGDHWFAFDEANADGLTHIKALAPYIFGVEDLPGTGDRDFNDLVFQLIVTSVQDMNPSLTVPDMS